MDPISNPTYRSGADYPRHSQPYGRDNYQQETMQYNRYNTAAVSRHWTSTVRQVCQDMIKLYGDSKSYQYQERISREFPTHLETIFGRDTYSKGGLIETLKLDEGKEEYNLRNLNAMRITLFPLTQLSGGKPTDSKYEMPVANLFSYALSCQEPRAMLHDYPVD